MVPWLTEPSYRFTTFSPFVRFLPRAAKTAVCFYCRSVLDLASSFTTPHNIPEFPKDNRPEWKVVSNSALLLVLATTLRVRTSMKFIVATPLPLLPLLSLLRPKPLLRLLAPLTRLQVRPTPRPTANASPFAPKAPKPCTQLMSGIEHPPSLLGNFHISEFGFRSSSARPIFGFVPIGRFTIWAVCWRCVSFLYWFCNCFGSYLLYLFSWLRFVTLVHLIIFFWLDLPFFSFDLLLNYFWFLVSLLFFFFTRLCLLNISSFVTFPNFVYLLTPPFLPSFFIFITGTF